MSDRRDKVVYDGTVTSGFLLVKTFERMCREYLGEFAYRWPQSQSQNRFAIPRRDVPLEEMPKRYRGMMRDPLQCWTETWAKMGLAAVEPTEQEYAASTRMWDLQDAERADDDFVFALEDAKELLAMIQPPVEREIIWARRMDVADSPPPSTAILGYEPAYFGPVEHNSAIAQCMFFAYWMIDGWNPEQLEPYFTTLNKWGLFDTPKASEEYLEAYLSALEPGTDEGERQYLTVEIRQVD